MIGRLLGGGEPQPGTAVTADDQSIAAGRDVNLGMSIEQLQALIAGSQSWLAASTDQQQQIASLSRRLGTAYGAMQALLAVLGQAGVPEEALIPSLIAQVTTLAASRQSLLPAVGDDRGVAELKAQAVAALDSGDFDAADEVLAAIGREQDRRLAGDLAARVATEVQRGELAEARLRYRDAAACFATAARLAPEEAARIAHLEREADLLYRQGLEFGDNAALVAAIRGWQRLLDLRPRERVPLDWAATQNNLGNALQTLGDRESSTARLEAAVVAYRAALTEFTRERVPLDWAMTQNNLGNALLTLGERASGTARLEEAVVAFCAALIERTRERVPLDWATTQNNLGNALQALGARESGTVRFEEAVTAYRAALTEYTRARVPLDWATTQNNLGNALRVLGEREGSTARLEEAVASYRAALLERTRERAPLGWATTQYNLGAALNALGSRANDITQLEEVVAAYRAALAERTRERVPLYWALTTVALALAQARVAERRHDPGGVAELAETAADARQVLVDGGHEPWARWGDYVLGEIARVRTVLGG